MISERMEKALNEQIALEAHASFLYLSMASWCDQQSLGGCANFMFRQSSEENDHMMRIFHYLLEMDARAQTPVVHETPQSYEDVRTMFRSVLEHEQKVTRSINDLVNMAIEENDHSTYNFLQWYVEEQREEETLMRGIIDKIRLIGDGPQSLYYIDKELAAINAAALKREAAEK